MPAEGVLRALRHIWLTLELLAGRMIDRADAAALLRANRESLDCDYLLHWIKALELRAAWTEVRIEAFPEQPPPDIP